MRKPESYEDFQERIFQQLRDLKDADISREVDQVLKAGITSGDIEMLKSGKSLEEVLKIIVERFRAQESEGSK
jgi:hypothetical protein